MGKYLALLAIGCLTSVGFATVTYDGGTKTLTYGDPSDLDSEVDPQGVRADVQQSFGIALADFNLLSPQVIGFNTATGSGAGTPAQIEAYYTAADKIIFNNFAPVGGVYGTYNWGSFTSNARDAFSGTEAYHNLGLVQSDPPGGGTVNYRFLSADVTVARQYYGMVAFGLCLHGRTDLATGPGELLYTLSDSTTASVVLPAWGGGNALQRLFVGYQAPAGRFIVKVEGIRYGGGNCFPASDDWGFLIDAYYPGDANLDHNVTFTDYQTLERNFGKTGLWTDGDFNLDGDVNFTDYQALERNFGTGVPEPGLMALLALGGLGLRLRRRR